MLKKKLCIVSTVLFLLLAVSAIAQENRSLSLAFTFYADGSIEASNIWVRYGSPDLRNAVENSDYKIVLSFKDKSTMDQFYDVIFLMAAETEQGPETLQSPYTFLNSEFAYKDNPDKIEVYHNGSLAYQKSIDSICNNDKACNNDETSISCPSDCSKSIKDGWCDVISDGICDQDCEETSDIDCSCGNNVCDGNEDPGICPDDCTAEEEISTDAPKFIFLLSAIIIIALCVIGFFIYKKTKRD